MYRYFWIELVDLEDEEILYSSALMVFSEMIKLTEQLASDYPDIKKLDIRIHAENHERPFFWVSGQDYKEPFP